MTHCWNLISPNPYLYPNHNACSLNMHPEYENEWVVYENDGNTYQFIYVGTCNCDVVSINSGFRILPQAPEINDCYKVVNCLTGQETTILTSVIDTDRYNTIRVAGECWSIVEVIKTTTEVFQPLEDAFNNCDSCITFDPSCCPDSDRTLAYGTRIVIPTPQPPNRGFAECCFKLTVLADLNNSDSYYNDFNSFYYQKQSPSDTIQFDLINTANGSVYSLHNTTYGIYKPFGSIAENTKLSYVTVEWRKVLQLLGAGTYQIRTITTIAGIAVTQLSNTYYLEHFNWNIANDTIRIDSYFSGKLISEDIIFKGSNFKDSLRIKGFFGREKPIYTQDTLIFKTYIEKQMSIKVDKEFQLQTNDIPECVGTYLQYFLLLGSELKISDYNKDNYSYKYNQESVLFSGVSDPEYFQNNRRTILNYTFVTTNKSLKKINY